MSSIEDLENTGEIILKKFPNGCPKCGSKKWKVEKVTEEIMERGLVRTGKILIKITCKVCGHIEHIPHS